MALIAETRLHGDLPYRQIAVAQEMARLVAEDNGETWQYGGHLFIGRNGYSPYTKYITNGRDTIHFVCTEDHPRNYDECLMRQ